MCRQVSLSPAFSSPLRSSRDHSCPEKRLLLLLVKHIKQALLLLARLLQCLQLVQHQVAAALLQELLGRKLLSRLPPLQRCVTAILPCLRNSMSALALVSAQLGCFLEAGLQGYGGGWGLGGGACMQVLACPPPWSRFQPCYALHARPLSCTRHHKTPAHRRENAYLACSEFCKA